MMAWVRLVMLALVVMASGASGQSVIEMRPLARVMPGGPVLVGDVAVLAGPEAEALAEVVVRDVWRAGEAISGDDVRRAADRAGRVHWGRVSLRGPACVLGEVVQARTTGAPTVAMPAPVNPEGTVRASIIANVARLAQADVQDLRISFAPDDEDLLSLATAGRTVEVTPTGMSDRLPLAVRLFEGDRIAASRTIRVNVEVRREVLIAGVSRRRGEMIGESDLTVGVQWLGLTARPARMEQVVGASPRMRVNAGQVVMVEDVAAPIVVSKGDQVMVHCVNGTFVVTMRARAMGAGRDGEMVLFQSLDSRETFYARMDGRGRAVMNLGGVRTEE